jgi:hypothetical protein
MFSFCGWTSRKMKEKTSREAARTQRQRFATTILWGDFWEKETVETLCIVPLRLPRYGRLIKRFARVSIEHVDVFGINVQCGSTTSMHTGTRVDAGNNTSTSGCQVDQQFVAQVLHDIDGSLNH